MGKIAEDSSFYKGKQTIIDEFSGKHKALLSTVAGRKFLKPPGYLLEASLALELVGKHKLSELNYNIVAEAVQRQLVQTGHEYSNTYKLIRTAFELEKQTLLAVLRNENADLDAAHGIAVAELDQLFVELDVRKIVLITTKTGIDLEMEALRQEMVATDSLTFDAEAALINEKIITANAKLAVIPHIEALLLAQEGILLEEESNLPLTESLIDIRGLLIEKKEEILPFIEDKANAQVLLADKKTELIPQITDKATAHVALSVKKEELLSFISEKIDAQVELSAVKAELLSYIEDRIDGQILLTDAKISLLPILTEKSLIRQQLSLRKEDLIPGLEAKADSIIAVANKEYELITPIAEKSSKNIDLAAATIRAIAVEAQRLGVATQKAKTREVKVDGALDVLSAENALTVMRVNLGEARQLLQLTKITNQQELSTERSQIMTNLASKHSAMFDQLSENKVTIAGGEMEARTGVVSADVEGDISATGTTVSAEKEAIRLVAGYAAQATTETASAAAKAKITSELIHLLGGS